MVAIQMMWWSCRARTSPEVQEKWEALDMRKAVRNKADCASSPSLTESRDHWNGYAPIHMTHLAWEE